MQDRLKALVHEMFDKGIRFADAQRELERHYIERAMQTAEENLGRAAALLGLHRNTLSRKLAELRRTARKYDRHP